MWSSNEKLLFKLFKEAVSSSQPDKIVSQHLPKPTGGRIIVLGAGKASAAMALAVEQAYKNEPLEGIVITQHGYGVTCEKIEIVEASHPIPDQDGLLATKRIFNLAQSAESNDLVLFLISGGGSSLLTLPPSPLSLPDQQVINRKLLESGATISEMNCIRKHISNIKGGRLTKAAYPAKMFTLLISDVPGDDPSVIASGPTFPDPSTSEDALKIYKKYVTNPSKDILEWLSSESSESPNPGDPIFDNHDFKILATPQMGLEAASKLAESYGFEAHILSDSIEGESRDVGIVHACIAKQVSLRNQPFKTPCILLSGGETTVTIRNTEKVEKTGKGGRNVEFLLSLALALDGHRGIYAIACDTDGIDGNQKVAGAIITPETVSRASIKGINLRKELDQNNAHHCFELLDSQVITGPTLTNINDFRAILIE